MTHSALAIIMTSLTTAAGLWSFSFSLVAPIGALGIFSSMGVMLGLLFTIILIPATLSLIKIKPKNIVIKNKKEVKTLMDKILLKIANISTTYPKTIIAISFFIVVIAISVASNLRFSHNPVVWFDEEHPVRVSTNLIDEKMGGSMTLEVIINTKKENGLYDNKVLNAMDNFSKNVIKIKSENYSVSKAISITDILKETNKALNENKESYYSIANTKELIAQELFLFANSGSDDMEQFVDSRFSKARITLKLPNIDAVYYDDLLKEVNDELSKNFGNLKNSGGESIEVSTTGISKLLSTIMSGAIYSSANSYALALVLITIMMIIITGSFKIGLISMIPNVLPILIMTTVMVIFNFPLDMFTMLIGAIAIGLAVDDTVHFLHNFAKYKDKYKDTKKAVQMTLMTTGRAMLVTTIVLACGFFVFMFASMTNLFNFGLLTGIAIITALLADFFLLPAIMIMLDKGNNKN
jgi:predicted RND superfamily exporter protein